MVIDGKDWHLVQWIRVALVGIFATWGASQSFDMLEEYFYLLFVFITIYWVVFDLTLNLFRGLPWHYVGGISWVDRKLRHWSFLIKIPMIFFSSLISMYYF